MREFLFALQFLTVFLFGTQAEIAQDKLSRSTAYFPLIGLFLGLILAATNQVLSFLLVDKLLTSVIIVTLLIILTGGLHLDGLADTIDALFSGKTKEEMLAIMRDAHIGTMGVLSLICVILLKVSFLFSFNPQMMNVALILMGLLSRYSLVLAMFLFPYVRQEGKAKAFVAGMNRKIFFSTSGISLFCAFIFLRLTGLIIFFMLVLFVILLGRFIAQKIGGITGDTLGAINELTEVFVLFNLLILSRVYL